MMYHMRKSDNVDDANSQARIDRADERDHDYYYDDSTGYEIYSEQDEAHPDEESDEDGSDTADAGN